MASLEHRVAELEKLLAELLQPVPQKRTAVKKPQNPESE